MSNFDVRCTLMDVVLSNLHDLEYQPDDSTLSIVFSNSSFKIVISDFSVAVYSTIHLTSNTLYASDVTTKHPVILYDIRDPSVIRLVALEATYLRHTMTDGSSMIMTIPRHEYHFVTDEAQYFQSSIVKESGAKLEQFQGFQMYVLDKIKKHQTLAFTDGDKCVTLRHPQKYF